MLHISIVILGMVSLRQCAFNYDEFSYVNCWLLL